MTGKIRKPAVFKADDAKLTVETPVEPAAPEPDAIGPELLPEDGTVPAVPAPPPPRGWSWSAILLSALGGLISLGIGLAATKLIEDLWARHEWLGWAGLGVLGLAVLAFVVICGRELVALRRMRKIGAMRTAAERGLRHEDDADCKSALRGLRSLYAGRNDVSWGLSRLAEHDRDVMDATDRLKLAERELMPGLDGEARRIIADAARRVSVITAVNPAPALDVAFVAAQNLSMLRRLAALYGGRPGTLGTFRLGRMVLTHLAVTGGLAVGDTFIQHILGKGLAGRLSAKLGEGVVNGIMTARIGIAALDLCRPLPFHVLERPSLQGVIGGVFSSGTDDTERKPKSPA